MSRENVELARRIYAGWARGDFSETWWADPEIEYLNPGNFEMAPARGIEAMGVRWQEWLGAWEQFRSAPERFIDLGDRVLVLNRFAGRGKRGGAPLDEMPGANVFEIREGRVVRLWLYQNRDHALRDLGLSEADLPPEAGS
jgi:ketosteroid isomerase-like protein